MKGTKENSYIRNVSATYCFCGISTASDSVIVQCSGRREGRKAVVSSVFCEGDKAGHFVLAI